MSSLKQTDRVFFKETGLDPYDIRKLVMNSLEGSDGGELYLQQTMTESLSWDQGRLVGNGFSVDEGFGLRFISGESEGYANSSEITRAAIESAADTVKGIRTHGGGGSLILPKSRVRTPVYESENPLFEMEQKDKIELLGKIDAYVRAKDPRVQQVNISLTGQNSLVQVIREDGHRVADIRPLVRLNVGVMVEQNGRREAANNGKGGRYSYSELFNEAVWKDIADEALRQASVNLESVPAPAGEMTVVMGNGWSGVMLHEAVGHGLEGDFNRKGSSAFSGKVGQQVASKGVTVVDQGNIEGRRGSLNYDDEGMPTQRNVLIEDGVLKGYMQDRKNARLMGVNPTGNGRRESYKYAPMPRMTNTFMEAGAFDPAEVLESVKDGIYIASLGGGQVDITSGNYVFEVTEAYELKDGKMGAPLKGATMVGNGPQSMNRISMVANDVDLDPGIGMCGKAGQNVPAGVGQPTMRIDGMTVGGTGRKPSP